jgi:hypothetical protein
MPFALLVVVYGKVGVIYSEVMGIDDDAYGQPRWLSLLKGVCVCVCVCLALVVRLAGCARLPTVGLWLVVIMLTFLFSMTLLVFLINKNGKFTVLFQKK